MGSSRQFSFRFLRRFLAFMTATFLTVTPTSSQPDRQSSAARSAAARASSAGAHLYTTTEVVAAIRSTNALADLANALTGQGRPLADLINLEASRELFALGQTKIEKITLRPGADPWNVVKLLQSLSFVEWAAPNRLYDTQTYGDPRELRPDDPLYPQQYHHPLMQNDLAWDVTHGNSSMVVAVTDDGVDLRHEDLAPNIWINQAEIPASRRMNLVDIDGDQLITFLDLNHPVNQGPFRITDINKNGRIDAGDTLAQMDMAGGTDLGTGGWANQIDEQDNGFIDDLHGWDFSSEDNDPNPIGAAAHGTHVSGIVAARTNNSLGVAGTAGHATIMPIRFYGSAPWTSLITARSYAYAVDNGAPIINTSYNVDRFADDPIYQAGLQYLYQQGGIHFNSAGNNNQLNPNRQVLDWSLFVVNTDASDRKSGSSNYGWGVDICAPGSAILSAGLNDTYRNSSGTSMASPNAAAVAALIWSARPNLTRDQVIAQLIGNADNIDNLQPPEHRGLIGSGRTNSFRGILGALAPPRFKNVLGLPDNGGSIGAPLTSFSIDVANVFDPAAMNDIQNWDLRSDGPDNVFDTGDDVVIPLTLTTDLGVGYLIGTNRLILVVSDPMTPERYRFRAVSGGLADPFGTPLDGNGDGVGGDHFQRTFVLTKGGS